MKDVSSTIVIRVAFLKAVIGLSPSKMGLRIVTWSELCPIAGIELNRAGKHHRPHVDGERTLTEGRGHRRSGSGVAVGVLGRIVRTSQVRHAGVGVDVAERQAQAGDVDMRQIPPCHDRAEGRVGEEVHVWPLSIDM